MSVRKGDREQGKLEVINASGLLLDYTYDRVKDRNIFPKTERWLLPKAILDAAVGARSCIIGANGIRVESTEEAHERLLKEKQAIGHLEALEALIDLCNLKEIIDDSRTYYWTGLVVTTMKKLKGWLKSDRRRYKEFLNGEQDSLLSDMLSTLKHIEEMLNKHDDIDIDGQIIDEEIVF